MRGALLAVIATAGCNAILGIDDFHAAGDDVKPPGDAPAGDGGDTGPNLECFGKIVNVCTMPLTGSLEILDDQLDTGTDPRCVDHPQPSGPPLCMIAAGNIHVGKPVRVVGPRPLVLAAHGITIDGQLDATAHRGAPPPAGANDGACVSAGKGMDDPNNGGTGGGGGGFGTPGAQGGSNKAGAPGGAGGGPLPGMVIHGGCLAARGGDGSPNTGGTPGDGGGAIVLVARDTITIASSGGVFASGGGGGGGNAITNPRGAGGGGGSGGTIGLDAPTLSIDGTLTANGGGGGGGGDAFKGQPGEDGATTSFDIAAAGGPNEGASHGGPGGSGGVLTSPPKPGLMPSGGGGGGGGGGAVGRILVRGAAVSIMRSSPPPTMVP